MRQVYPRTGTAAMVGFTGPPGVGKSTLIGALTAHARKANRQVAVLSIDFAVIMSRPLADEGFTLSIPVGTSSSC